MTLINDNNETKINHIINDLKRRNFKYKERIFNDINIIENLLRNLSYYNIIGYNIKSNSIINIYLISLINSFEVELQFFPNGTISYFFVFFNFDSSFNHIYIQKFKRK